jgi:putative FmdB family regulatory protein
VPLYEYQCPRCGRFELIQKFADAPLSACPNCGAEVQKLLSAPAIQFKGTGWYITDYARKPSGGEKGKPAESSAAGSGSGDGEASGKAAAKEGSSPGGGSPVK